MEFVSKCRYPTLLNHEVHKTGPLSSCTRAGLSDPTSNRPKSNFTIYRNKAFFNCCLVCRPARCTTSQSQPALGKSPAVAGVARLLPATYIKKFVKDGGRQGLFCDWSPESFSPNRKHRKGHFEKGDHHSIRPVPIHPVTKGPLNQTTVISVHH